jgi:hypothetical protein
MSHRRVITTDGYVIMNAAAITYSHLEVTTL